MAHRQTSLLLQLPAEIRNAIYHYTFHGSEIDLNDAIKDHNSPTPSLVMVCKQIHDETLWVYYRNLTINLKNGFLLHKFLVHLTSLPALRSFRLIKRIKIDCYGWRHQAKALSLGQRFDLSRRCQLLIERAKMELKAGGNDLATIEVSSVIVSPSGDIVWAERPYDVHLWLQEQWTGLTEYQQRTVEMESWAPSGVRGLVWNRA